MKRPIIREKIENVRKFLRSSQKLDRQFVTEMALCDVISDLAAEVEKTARAVAALQRQQAEKTVSHKGTK